MASVHISRAFLRSSSTHLNRSLRCATVPPPAYTRALSSLPKVLLRANSLPFPSPQLQAKRIYQLNSYRAFSTSLTKLTEDNKYRPGAYVASGVLEASKGKLADVKKVLVIGSGGLSIGQAGEFDYSGTRNFVLIYAIYIGSILI